MPTLLAPRVRSNEGGQEKLVRELGPLVTRLYAGGTGETGVVLFAARMGVDAGCPFSFLLLCLGLHHCSRKALKLVSVREKSAFMDDACAMCLMGSVARRRKRWV